MTHAVCVLCGAMKFGAFTPCPACGRLSGARDLQGPSLFWSEYHWTEAELRAISAHVLARGEFPEVRKVEAEGGGRPRWVLADPPERAAP